MHTSAGWESDRITASLTGIANPIERDGLLGEKSSESPLLMTSVSKLLLCRSPAHLLSFKVAGKGSDDAPFPQPLPLLLSLFISWILGFRGLIVGEAFAAAGFSKASALERQQNVTAECQCEWSDTAEEPQGPIVQSSSFSLNGTVKKIRKSWRWDKERTAHDRQPRQED